ncbi:MAG: HAMP domain-containing histidine kinase [Gammaproteobacteria bacterium]|nr:HAMP domain-containing histidine kinase [Gammaproteobacteria bacterium]
MSFRLTLWYSAAFVGFLLCALLALYLSTNSILNGRMDDDLREDIAEFRILFEAGGTQRVIDEIEREVASGNDSSVFLRLLDREGGQTYASDLSHWTGLATNRTLVQRLVDEDSVSELRTTKFSSQDFETRTIYGVIGPDTILHIGESMEQKEEFMELLLAIFALMFMLVIPLASAVGWVMARRAVQGVEEVTRAAIDIERGALDRRVSIKAQDAEIQKLADTFNAMAERIRTLISEMREMIDNIAHDLRSPLTRIRAILESTLSAPASTEEFQAAAANTLEECDRLMQLINVILDVAEAEAGVGRTIMREVDISKLTADACELFEPVADEKCVQMSTKIEPDCRLQGDRQNLQRMLANLLDNALKYTPARGKVSVDLAHNSKQIEIAVTDTGIGIPAPDRHRVFERFFRCDQSRSKEGCGLGLSFARAVARAHGGEIHLSSAPDISSIFTITLPSSCHPPG